MHDYMVTIRFPSDVDQEFFSLIPAQRALVNQLLSRGVIRSYSLSADRRTLWMALSTESDADVIATLELMPLYKYMTFESEQLMFHNAPAFTPQRLSMN